MSGYSEESSGADTCGLRLRTARELRSLTLEDVARTTRISKTYLQALEDNDLDKLPSDAYARGFLRVYASFLGLSPEDLGLLHGTVRSLPEDIEEPNKERPSLGHNQTLVFLRRGLLPLVLITAGLALALVMFFPSPKAVVVPQNGTVTPAPVLVPSAVTHPESTPTVPPAEASLPLPVKPESSHPATRATEEPLGLILKLRAVVECAVMVTMDEAVSEHYMLKPGDNVELKAAQYIVLELENAGGVEAELNGKVLSPFGKEGEAARTVLTAEQRN